MPASVVLAYAALAGAVVCYGASSLLLSEGSHAVRGGVYLSGLAAQAAAFLLAFLARADLPLLLVQACVSASVAVTALAGQRLGRWRLDRLDLTALAAVVAGIALTGVSSLPTRAVLGGGAPMLVALLVAVAALATVPVPVPASATGALAGLAYGSSAVAARGLAADPLDAVRSPTGLLAAAVLVTGLGIGQVLLTVAFRRGAAGVTAGRSGGVTGPVAAMYVAATVWPALAGLLWLGDAVRPGAGIPAALGVVLALAGTTVLARHEM